MHPTQKLILTRLAKQDMTKNQMKAGASTVKHLGELVSGGYVAERTDGRYLVFCITAKGQKALIEEDVQVLSVVQPRKIEYKPWQPMVDKTVYRPGSLDAFKKPSMMAHGKQAYKSALKD